MLALFGISIIPLIMVIAKFVLRAGGGAKVCMVAAAVTIS